MNCFRIKAGVAAIADGDSGWFIMDETGRKRITSALVAELIGLICRGLCDEDDLVAALEDRFAPNRIYHVLIQLEKQGIIVKDTAQAESPADLFQVKARGQERIGYALSPGSVMTVRIIAIGGADASADGLAVSLARSEMLRVERIEHRHLESCKPTPVFPGACSSPPVASCRHSQRLSARAIERPIFSSQSEEKEGRRAVPGDGATSSASGQARAPLMEGMTADVVYVVVTPDYLEPGLEAFGRLAHECGLRWLPVKLSGVIPWIGPFFIPGETGCLMCLLDRVRGHRRLEVEKIRENEANESLRLSVGQTIHSFETVSGLLATELEKLAADGTPEITGRVFTLDFRTLRLTRHRLIKRQQCPMCGTLSQETARTRAMPKEPLRLQSRVKADYRDGGERVCSAVETLERYALLVSPVTGVVGRLTLLEGVPPCFGQVIKGEWIVRGIGERKGNRYNGRLSATGLSTGKGRTEPQARASALGEAVERYCSQHEGYESHVRASFLELGDVAVHPQHLMGFSERQYADRDFWRQQGGIAYVPDPYDAARPIDWTPAWSLTQRRWRLIPSSFVYYSYPRAGGGDICNGSSNGVAAGNCLEEAIIQGFFELVERDATAMWWYHKLSKPAVDWRSFDSPFAAAVDADMNEMGMKLEVLDLTNDLGIPVFSASLFDRNEGDRFKSIGLGCHRNPHIALERAISELGQSWRLANGDAFTRTFQNSSCSREPFLRPDPCQTPKVPSDFMRKQSDDFLDDIEEAVRLLHARELEMLVLDLTRPDVGFPVARVIVPGLMHFWPRFGCRRLFEVPKAAGWIDDRIGEDDLNPMPFFL